MTLIEKVARAFLDAPGCIDGVITHEMRARAAMAVVLKDQLEWVSDKAHENCGQGSDLWDWKASLDAAIRAYARENGVSLDE